MTNPHTGQPASPSRPLLDVAAISAARAARTGRWDNAITATALALTYGADNLAAPSLPGQSHALACLSEALSILGAHDRAERVAVRAVATARGPTARTTTQLNLIRVRTIRSFDCEFNADLPGAASCLTAAMAATLHRRAGEVTLDAAVAVAVRALNEPRADYLPALAAGRSAPIADDVAISAIAEMRCLARAGGAVELALLDSVITEDPRLHPVLRIALNRELATRNTPPASARSSLCPDRLDPRIGLVAALEAEVRARRDAHAGALRHALAHHRLRLEQGHLARQAMTDALTRLPNRRAADQYLLALAGSGRPAAVAVIDLDGFKPVNDQHSHAIGDRVLRTVADCLRRGLRSADLLSRYGGDEFVAVLSTASLPEAATTLCRIATAVAALPTAFGVTVSVGITALEPGGNPTDALIRADAAMYQAKQAGGNAVAVSSDR